jgi:hypothetical protein
MAPDSIDTARAVLLVRWSELLKSGDDEKRKEVVRELIELHQQKVARLMGAWSPLDDSDLGESPTETRSQLLP